MERSVEEWSIEEHSVEDDGGGSGNKDEVDDARWRNASGSGTATAGGAGGRGQRGEACSGERALHCLVRGVPISREVLPGLFRGGSGFITFAESGHKQMGP